MNKAGETISNSLSGAATTLADLLNIDLLKKYNVGVQVTFFGPTEWYQTQQDEKATTASAFGFFILIMGGLGLTSSAVDQTRKKKKPTQDDMPNFGKKSNGYQQLVEEQEIIERDSTKPFTIKARHDSDGNPVRLDSVGNPLRLESVGNIMGNRENSLFENRLRSQVRNEYAPITAPSSIPQAPKTSPVVDTIPPYNIRSDPILLRLLSCFSPVYNVQKLCQPRFKKGQDPELDIFEGLRFLTM